MIKIKKVQARLPADVNDAMETICEKNKIGKSELIRKALIFYIEKNFSEKNK